MNEKIEFSKWKTCVYIYCITLLIIYKSSITNMIKLNAIRAKFYSNADISHFPLRGRKLDLQFRK